jgi:hypothetical protein
MSSANSGYITLAVIGGIVAALFAGGLYYASEPNENLYAPTGMRAYSQGNQRYFGGRRKTGKRKTYVRKSRKLTRTT